MGKEAQKNLSVAAQTVSMAAAGAPLGPVGCGWIYFGNAWQKNPKRC